MGTIKKITEGSWHVKNVAKKTQDLMEDDTKCSNWQENHPNLQENTILFPPYVSLFAKFKIKSVLVNYLNKRGHLKWCNN